MQINPRKFSVISLALGPVEALDLELDNKRLSLSLEALKAADNAVFIHLYLKLLIGDGFGIDVVYAVEFEVAEPNTPDFVVNDEVMLRPFIQVNAPAIAYPFLRSYVSTICVNSGFSPVLLPPVNFQAIYNKRKASQDGVGQAKISVTN